MRRWILALLLAGSTAAFALSGCAKPGPDTFAEAEALEAQGKLEEAAARFELAGVRAADARAAGAWIKAAEKAMAEGRFVAAERLFVRALTTADDATAKNVGDRLTSDDLKQGLAYERALGQAYRPRAFEAMEKIAATPTPAAARAQAWLDHERPRLPEPTPAPVK